MPFIDLPADVLRAVLINLSSRDLAAAAATCTALLRGQPNPTEEVLLLRAAMRGRAWMNGPVGMPVGWPLPTGTMSRSLYLARLEHIHGETCGIVAVLGRIGGLCISGNGSLMECTFGAPLTHRMGRAPTRLKLTPMRSMIGLTTRSVATERGGFMSAVASNGCVYTWGECRTPGVLGHGLREVHLVPTLLRALCGHRILSVAAGGDHCIAVAEDGVAWSWGLNLYGECGHGLDRFVEFPRRMQLPMCIRGAACGSNHSLLWSSEGTVFFTGTHRVVIGSRLGGIPVAIGALRDHRIVATSAGSNHSLALSTDGIVFAWGSNFDGELGQGTCSSDREWRSEHPVIVDGVRNVHVIAAGGRTSCAVTSDGRLCMWGLGYGPEPKLINCGSVAAVSVQDSNAVAVGFNGSVFGWRAIVRRVGGKFVPDEREM